MCNKCYKYTGGFQSLNLVLVGSNIIDYDEGDGDDVMVMLNVSHARFYYGLRNRKQNSAVCIVLYFGSFLLLFSTTVSILFYSTVVCEQCTVDSDCVLTSCIGGSGGAFCKHPGENVTPGGGTCTCPEGRIQRFLIRKEVKLHLY